MTYLIGQTKKVQPNLPLTKLNRPLHILYTLGADEYRDYIQDSKTPNASSMYRIFFPFALMNASGEVECQFCNGFFTKHGNYSIDINPHLEWADIVVFARINTEEPVELRKLLSYITKLNKVVVFEHDDYYFQFGRGNYHRHNIADWSLINTQNVIKCADLVMSPNFRLNDASCIKANATPLLKAAIPNAIFLAEWDQAAAFRQQHDKTRILLSGATQHYVDWLWAGNMLKKVKAKYGDTIEFHVQGFTPEVIEHSKNRDKYMATMTTDTTKLAKLLDSLEVTYHPPVDFKYYAEAINKVSPDIGLAITGDLLQDHCKSTLKWIDYTMAGAAVLCSNFPPYSDELIDNHNALLASNITEWKTKLEYLIDNPMERVRLQANAEAKVKEAYTIHTTYKEYIKAFKEVYALKHGE